MEAASVGRPTGPGEGARRVESMVARHGPALLRVANQFSLCHDDALDAYQRGLEIYLRRLETVDPATEGAWLRVVVKHKAMAIRRARQASVGHEDVDLDASIGALRDVEDEVAGGERVERSVEALRALKPDEAKALMLKAQGLSYQEIGRRYGWTYTKVNRAITEGRRRFIDVFAGSRTARRASATPTRSPRWWPGPRRARRSSRCARTCAIAPPAARRCASCGCRAAAGSPRSSPGCPGWRGAARSRPADVQYAAATAAGAGGSGRPWRCSACAWAAPAPRCARPARCRWCRH